MQPKTKKRIVYALIVSLFLAGLLPVLFPGNTGIEPDAQGKVYVGFWEIGPNPADLRGCVAGTAYGDGNILFSILQSNTNPDVQKLALQVYNWNFADDMQGKTIATRINFDHRHQEINTLARIVGPSRIEVEFSSQQEFMFYDDLRELTITFAQSPLTFQVEDMGSVFDELRYCMRRQKDAKPKGIFD